jgi:hypothetical protein
LQYTSKCEFVAYDIRYVSLLGALGTQLHPSCLGGMLVAVGGRAKERMEGRGLAAKLVEIVKGIRLHNTKNTVPKPIDGVSLTLVGY